MTGTFSDADMRIVLFDIDGTILRSGGVGRIAMERALQYSLRFNRSQRNTIMTEKPTGRSFAI